MVASTKPPHSTTHRKSDVKSASPFVAMWWKRRRNRTPITLGDFHGGGEESRKKLANKADDGSVPTTAATKRMKKCHEVCTNSYPSGLTTELPKFKINAENLVFTASTGDNINLLHVSRMLHDIVEYNRHKFAAAIIRLSDPAVTILLFSTGNIVCTGCKSSHCAFTALEFVTNALRSIGMTPRKKELRLQNVVGSTDIRNRVYMDYVNQELDEESTLEPELFPGLIFRPYDGDATLLLFESGKVVITGSKTERNLMRASRHVERLQRINNDAAIKKANGEDIVLHRHSKHTKTVTPAMQKAMFRKAREDMEALACVDV